MRIFSKYVTNLMTIYELDLTEHRVAEHRLPIQFSLIDFEVFQELVQLVGFDIEEVFGNYDFSPFDQQTSPYMIVCTRKRNM